MLKSIDKNGGIKCKRILQVNQHQQKLLNLIPFLTML